MPPKVTLDDLLATGKSGQELLEEAKAVLARGDKFHAGVMADVQGERDQATARGYEDRYSTPGKRAIQGLKEFGKGAKEGLGTAAAIGSFVPHPAVNIPARAYLAASSAASLPGHLAEGDAVGSGMDALGMAFAPGAGKALKALRGITSGAKAAPTVVRDAEMFADAAGRTRSATGSANLGDAAADASGLRVPNPIVRGADEFADAASRSRGPASHVIDPTASAAGLRGLITRGGEMFDDAASRARTPVSSAVDDTATAMDFGPSPIIRNEELGSRLDEAATQFGSSLPAEDSPNVALAALKKLARQDEAARVVPANPTAPKQSIAGFSDIDDLLSEGEASRISSNIKAILARRNQGY
jgi:hypothetical protein